MSYYTEYLASLFKKELPEGWVKTEKGYRKGEIEILLQEDEPEEGWNTAVFRNGKIEGCWYSCQERAGIMVKAMELINSL